MLEAVEQRTGSIGILLMARVPVPLGRTFGKGVSKAAGMSSLVNMYGERVELEGRTDWVCYPCGGLALFSTIGGGIVRGQLRANDEHYAVVGTRLYKVTGAGVSTDLGEVEGSDYVDMAFNGNQLVIVADIKSYSYDVATLALTEISDPNFELASSCASVASYEIYSVKDTGRFRWRLTNTSTFEALDFATAEAESDALEAVRAVGNEVALLGRTSLEIWGPTGDTGADAFAKTSTASVQIGCVSRDAAIVMDSGLTFVGRDGKAGGVSVYRMEGYTPRKVSPPEVDVYLEGAATPSDIKAFAYQQRGHLFYVLTLPNEWTLYWDVATNTWGYRKSGYWAVGAEPDGGWDAVTYALNGSKQIVGGSEGNLYEITAAALTEGGVGINREATSAQLYFNGKRTFMTRLELELEAGVGLSSGQGSDPVVMMSVSDDGGKTWSAARNAGMGAIGQNKWRAIWLACGSFRQRVVKFRVSDPVQVVFVTAHADVTVGAH